MRRGDHNGAFWYNSGDYQGIIRSGCLISQGVWDIRHGDAALTTLCEMMSGSAGFVPVLF